MIRKSFISACLLVAGGALAGETLVGTSTANGQEYVLEELYGRGVHRFFAHDYASAMENLTLAIDNGSNDPRAYYFRGLAAGSLGQLPQAESDLQMGAMLEAKGTYGDLIGRSLARVQGPVRMHIEKLRQLARLELLAQKRAKDDIRFEQGVLPSDPGTTPPTNSVTPPPSTQPAVPPTPTEENPFADDPLSGDGEPMVDTSDALGGAIENAQPTPVAPAAGNEAPVPAPGVGNEPPAGNEPFPFGGGSDTPSEDPFGF